MSDSSIADLQAFFSRPVAQAGTGPLKDGFEVALYIDEEGPATLTKQNGTAVILATPPRKADMTFWISRAGLQKLMDSQATEVGEIGVAILQLMTSSDPSLQMKAKVHAGMFDLLRKGYLGVIPLGGATLMKFLSSRGFTGIGKIKDAISRLRS
jgi:hypothetical protein